MATSLPPGFELDAAPAAPPTMPVPAASVPGLPEGFELDDEYSLDAGSVTYTPPKAIGAAGATVSPDELKTTLMEMSKRGVPFEDLNSYVSASGYSFDDDTTSWLQNAYTEGLRNPDEFGTTIEDWEIQGPPPEIGTGEAAWRGMKSGALRGFDDEVAGFGGAVGNKIGTTLGLNDSDADFWDIYQQIAEKDRIEKDAAWDQHPVAYGAGFIPGSIMGYRLGPSGATAPATGLARARQAARIGATEGAISGAGNADSTGDENFLERIPDALVGAGAGAVVAPIADRVLGGIVSGGRSAWERFGPMSRSPDSGLNALGNRITVDPPAMRAEAARMRDAGVEPRLVDVVPDEGRNVIREAAQAPTPARAEVAQHAEGVYADAPDRIAQQAMRISDDRRSATRIAEDATAGRDASMTAAMEPIRNTPVNIPEDDRMWAVLATDEGRSAARAAARLEADPATKEALIALSKPLTKPEGYDEIAAMHDQVRSLGLAPQAEAAALAQLPPLPEMPKREITLDMADKLARSFNDAAEVASRAGNNGRASVLRGYGRDIRQSASAANENYAGALSEYGAASRVADAATGRRGSDFEDSSFLKTAPDQFAEARAAASDVPAAIPEGGGPPAPTPIDDSMIAAGRQQTAGDEYLMESVKTYLRDPDNFTSGPGGATREQVESYLTNMERLIEASPLSSPTALHRGAVMQRDELDELLGGGEFVMGKPLAFSSDRNVAAGYADVDAYRIGVPEEDAKLMPVMFELDAPQGGHAASMDSISGDDLSEYALSGQLPILRTRMEGDVTVITLDPGAMPMTRPPPPTRPTVSEQDALRVRARDEVTTSALEGRGQGALPIARQIASGPNQQARNAALLGGRRARELEEGMGAEVRRVENTEAIDPRAGSSPRMRAEQRRIDGFTTAVEAGMAAGTANKWWLARLADRWLRQGGIRDVDAERLSRDAISQDPARVDAAINFLEQKGMSRAGAQRFVTTMASGITGRAVATDQAEPTPPINSVRAIYRQGGQP